MFEAYRQQSTPSSGAAYFLARVGLGQHTAVYEDAAILQRGGHSAPGDLRGEGVGDRLSVGRSNGVSLFGSVAYRTIQFGFDENEAVAGKQRPQRSAMNP